MFELNVRRSLVLSAIGLLAMLSMGASTTRPANIAEATKARDDARASLSTVEMAHRKKFEATKEYKDAVDKLAAAKDAMERARDSDDYKLRAATLNAFAAARKAMKELTEKSEAEDVDLKSARQNLNNAESNLADLKDMKQMQQRREVEAAHEAAEARKTQTRGDITVRIGGVLRAKVPLKDEVTGRQTLSKDEQIIVVLGLLNTSASQKYMYRTWQADGLAIDVDPAVLRDDVGNIYRRVNWGFLAKPIGRTDDASIYPLKGVADVLVFELPVDKARTLHLTLPGSNVGVKGDFKFDIDVDEIKAAPVGDSIGGN